MGELANALLAAALLIHAPAPATSDVKHGIGVMCDTAAQAHAYAANLAAGDWAEGAAATAACEILNVAFVQGKTVDKVTLPNGHAIQIVDVLVVAVELDGKWQALSMPVEQFTAIIEDDEGA
jgi:hypothetical protein